MSRFLRVVPDLHHRSIAQVLGDQGEGAMVTPLSIDMQVASPQSLLLKTEFLDDPQARNVLRSDVDLHPRKPQHQERVSQAAASAKGTIPCPAKDSATQ